MKHKGKILFLTLFTMLAHYFVLTYFKVDGTESFVGKVEKIEAKDKGIFPSAEVKFQVETENEKGDRKLITKTISLIKNDIRKFKVGHSYQIKAHKHWLLTER